MTQNKKINILLKKALALPHSPGVYIMKDNKKSIIYIGKAKNLKNRVSQYFSPSKEQLKKVEKMVFNVDTFEYIITDSEFEALVLECSLIKQYQPKYNILLKDDKGYHYIKISNEEWPKITEAKQKNDKNAKYLGPYTSSSTVKSSIDEALKIFKLPTCNRNFSNRNKNSRACLNYYINQCSAPCIGKIKKSDYLESINEAIDFLKNGNSSSIKDLTKKMLKASDNLEFEKAAKIRDKINSLNKISKDKQKVILSNKENIDVIALAKSEDYICFEIFNFIGGKLHDRKNFIFKETEVSNSIRTEFIERYYSDEKNNIPSTIFTDEEIENFELLEKWLSTKSNKKVKFVVPKKGIYFDLIKMCKNNAFERLAQKINIPFKETNTLENLAKTLNLKTIPEYIEAYDISNLGENEIVAGMVVFFKGKPLKKAYRKFKIKNTVGQDDYASMYEVISRRLNEYEKQKNENKGFGRLPDLILLDGGKGHVSTIKKLIKEKGIFIPVFGMVKDNKHKTRAITDDGSEIEINNNRSTFTLISNIQEEVHRFAISYHRNLRKNNTLFLELESISGIGKKRAKILLDKFKTIENIKNSNVQDLTTKTSIPENVCKNIYDYFN